MQQAPSRDLVFGPKCPASEDILLWRAFRASPSRRFVKTRAPGVAQDSILDGLAECGWSGLTLISGSASDDIFAARRPGDEIVVADHALGGAQIAEILVDAVKAWSPDIAIDILMIDSDGREAGLLAAARLETWLPSCIVLHGAASAAAHRALSTAGYRQAHFAGRHSFYIVESEWDRLALHFLLPPLASEIHDGVGPAAVAIADLVDHTSKLTQRLLAAERDSIRSRNALARVREIAAREIEAQAEEIRRAQAAMEAARHTIWSLERRIEDIFASTSWKVARPLRLASRIVQGLARGPAGRFQRINRRSDTVPAERHPVAADTTQLPVASRLAGQAPDFRQAD